MRMFSAKAVCGRMVSAALAAGLSLAAFGKNYYVAPWGDDSNDGLSWATAMKSPEVVVVDRWNNTPGHTLTISNGTYKLTKRMACTVSGNGTFTIKSLTGDPKDVILDGQGKCGGIYLYAGYGSLLEGLTVTNCVLTDGDGAGIFMRDTNGRIKNCIVSDCHVYSSAASCQGGGVSTLWCTISGTTVENCSITNAVGKAGKTAQGGGINAYRTQVTNCIVRNCAVFSHGTSVWSAGGGIYASDDTDCAYNKSMPIQSVYDTEISGCVAYQPNYNSGGCGAAISITCQIKETEGGPQYQSVVSNCRIFNCTNWYQGPLTLGQHVTVVNTTVSNCCDIGTYGYNHGTGIWMSNWRNRVRGCRFVGNIGTTGELWGDGTPAVHLHGGCSLVDCAVIGNTGPHRVGLNIASACSNALVSNCLFKANRTTHPYHGGLVSAGNLPDGAKVEIVDSYFVENNCATDAWGGWFYVNNNTVRDYEILFRNCLCANNRFQNAILVYANSSAKTDSKLKATFENCTITSNRMVSAGYCVVHGYTEGTHSSPYRIFLRGCIVADNPGVSQIQNLIYSATNNVNYSVFPLVNALNTSHPLSVGNRVYDPDKPLFANAKSGDFRLPRLSQARDMVPASAWMGTGLRNGPKDLGAGYALQKADDWGVTVRRLSAKPRLDGDLADAGCCEYYSKSGFILVFR